MITLVLIVTLLALSLIGVALFIFRRDRQYEHRSTKETLSDEMRWVIQHEREEGQAKKAHFETILKQASQSTVPSKDDDSAKESS